MAEATLNAKESKEKAEAPPYQGPRQSTAMITAAVVVAWLVPGGGHFLMKRWGRGALLLVSVAAMFVLGVLMEGKIYHANTGDLLDMLGFVGDVGAGGLYFVSRLMGIGRGAIELATADYGTKYIIVSGLLNFMCIVDAYHVAIGKKP
jgi:hypothetical protein